MNKQKNFSYMPLLVAAFILFLLMAFKSSIIKAYQNKFKKVPTVSPDVLPVVTPAEIIKTKLVTKPSILKSNIDNKRSIRSIKQPFLFDLPNNDSFPFKPIKEGFWNPKINSMPVIPFNSNLFQL